jgi:hypothetical protein
MDAFLVLSILGIILSGFGIYVLRGGYKRLYITPNRLPVVAPEAFKYVFLPAGVAITVFALAMPPFVPDSARDIFFYTGASLLVVAMVLSILSPRWLKPRWLAYLEDVYGRTFTQAILLPAAGDDPDWPRRMRTLEDVKLWAAGVAEQMSFPPHLGRIDREAWRQIHQP